jgi:UDP-N-acetylmuramate dehydrogenase
MTDVLDDVFAELDARLPGAVTRDVPLASLTTYKLGGPVAVLVRLAREDDLSALATVVAERRPPLLFVGRGSNLLVADTGFAGVGVVLEGEFETLALDEPGGTVTAGGALPLPVLARRSAAAGRAGLEFYVGIPGSVGGAVRMNAGGHGRETAEVLVTARVADLGSGGRATIRPVASLGLGYRRSGLGPGEVVVGASFATDPDAADACEARVAEIVRWRREHQPGGANAGSVFANPDGDSAGRLIDASGCKGLRVGGAVVSEKHANFFQAEPGATAADVRSLVLEVQRQVLVATGVELRPELRMVGFGEPESRASGDSGLAPGERGA